jgi:hypothetical protein
VVLLRFYYQYTITIKGEPESKGTILTQHEDLTQDLTQITQAIQTHVEASLARDSKRDMQTLFTNDNIEDIKGIIQYPLNASKGDIAVKDSISLAYKSRYFATEGVVTVEFSKAIAQKVDAHHQSVWQVGFGR